MLGQPVIHEGVVCSQQINDVVVLANDAVEQHFGLLAECLAQVVVEVGEVLLSGRELCRFRRYSHCPAKLLDQSLRLRIGEHALDLCVENGRIFSFFCSATVRSSSSGMLLHRKNDSRDASSRSPSL